MVGWRYGGVAIWWGGDMVGWRYGGVAIWWGGDMVGWRYGGVAIWWGGDMVGWRYGGVAIWWVWDSAYNGFNSYNGLRFHIQAVNYITKGRIQTYSVCNIFSVLSIRVYYNIVDITCLYLENKRYNVIFVFHVILSVYANIYKYIYISYSLYTCLQYLHI